MIAIDDTIIRELILHKIGIDGQNTINNNAVEYTAEDEVVLKRILLKPFSNQFLTYEFTHKVGLEYNVLFNLTKSVYEEENFVEDSQKIVQHLASVSKHANIKEGEVFVAKFEDIQLDNKYYQGLGIYKFEDKETYIETTKVSKEVRLHFKKGIGSKKPDKACLIIFTDEPYTLFIIDNNNGTDYWQNDFINHRSKSDAVNNTTDLLNLTKNFITEQIPQEFEVTKTDQINLLNRSVEYFKTHDAYDKHTFENEVFQDGDVINSFRKFDDVYRQQNSVDLSDQFEISREAVKKQARIFKSVLKLDKNFHIYIHGNQSMIEQGIDENGRKFYKIFYEHES